MFETLSNYAVAAMMIERCIVVFFPLRAKSIVTRRFTYVLIWTCIIPGWVLVLPLSVFVFEIQSGSDWSATGMFCGWNSNSPVFNVYLWLYQLTLFTVHVVIVAILVIVLCIVVIYRQKHRLRHLVQTVRSQDRNRVGGESNNSALIIMLLIAVMNIAVFIPGLLTMWLSFLVDSTTWSSYAQITLANFGRFGYEVPCITHSLNFVVYFFKIPTFRNEVSKLFSFCISK